jgi:hypothetical protein
MTTTLRQGFVTGSGAVLDVTSNVTVSDTRVRSIFATGVGTFLITGTSTDDYGNVQGSNIKFVLDNSIQMLMKFSCTDLRYSYEWCRLKFLRQPLLLQ